MSFKRFFKALKAFFSSSLSGGGRSVMLDFLAGAPISVLGNARGVAGERRLRAVFQAVAVQLLGLGADHLGVTVRAEIIVEIDGHGHFGGRRRSWAAAEVDEGALVLARWANHPDVAHVGF